MKAGNLAKIALIVLILYVAGILLPLGAFIWAVQKDLVLTAWSTGNVILLAGAVAIAILIGLAGWLKRLADRV